MKPPTTQPPTSQKERASLSPTDSAEFSVVSCPSLEVMIKSTDTTLVSRIQTIFSASAVLEHDSLLLEQPARLICDVTQEKCDIAD